MINYDYSEGTLNHKMGVSRRRTRRPTATNPNQRAPQEFATLLSALENDGGANSRWLLDQLRPYGDHVAFNAADELFIGGVLSAPASRALPSLACGAAAALGAALPEWISANPAGALSLFGVLGTRLDSAGAHVRESVCEGIEAAARAVAGKGAAQRGQVAAAAPAAAAALASCAFAGSTADWRSRACAWAAVAALARAASRALVPCWALFLPADSSSRTGLAGALLGARSAAERAAAADAAAALLAGGAPFVGARTRNSAALSAAAFTTAAETARRAVAAICDVLASALPLEKDRDVSAKLAKAAAVLASVAHTPTLSLASVERLLTALAERVATGLPADATTRAASLIAIAAILNGSTEALSQSSIDSAADVLLPILRSADDNVSHVPLEEALVVLQAVCKTSVDTVYSKWSLILPSLRYLAGSEREVLALHTVRVAEHILAALLADQNSHEDCSSWGIEVYAVIAQNGFDHCFHAVRSSAALCAEYLLRLHLDRGGDIAVLSAAKDSLIKAALGDNAHAVQCLAVRSLGVLPLNHSSPSEHDSLISALHGLMQLTKSDALQSRCAWALASLVDASATSNPPIAGDKYVSLLRACAHDAVELLHQRAASLGSGKGRSSDSDALATGTIRLLSVSMQALRLLAQTIEVGDVDADAAVEVLCRLVAINDEAPKARWNACRVLGDLLEYTSATVCDMGVQVLVDASLSARSAKVRAAAARALLPTARNLGTRVCARVFIAARNFSDAPREQCEAHVSAAASLVHESLADSCIAEAFDHAEARALIDAVASHNELPAYVLNPRACLPPGELGAAAPSAVLGALAADAHAALAAALTAVAIVLDNGPDTDLRELHDHLRGLLKEE